MVVKGKAEAKAPGTVGKTSEGESGDAPERGAVLHPHHPPL